MTDRLRQLYVAVQICYAKIKDQQVEIYEHKRTIELIRERISEYRDEIHKLTAHH